MNIHRFLFALIFVQTISIALVASDTYSPNGTVSNISFASSSSEVSAASVSSTPKKEQSKSFWKTAFSWLSKADSTSIDASQWKKVAVDMLKAEQKKCIGFSFVQDCNTNSIFADVVCYLDSTGTWKSYKNNGDLEFSLSLVIQPVDEDTCSLMLQKHGKKGDSYYGSLSPEAKIQKEIDLDTLKEELAVFLQHMNPQSERNSD